MTQNAPSCFQGACAINAERVCRLVLWGGGGQEMRGQLFGSFQGDCAHCQRRSLANRCAVLFQCNDEVVSLGPSHDDCTHCTQQEPRLHKML